MALAVLDPDRLKEIILRFERIVAVYCTFILVATTDQGKLDSLISSLKNVPVGLHRNFNSYLTEFKRPRYCSSQGAEEQHTDERL